MYKKHADSIKSLFKHKYKVLLDEADLLEIQDSMFYLGRAIFRYKLLQKQGKIKKDV